MAIHRGMGAPHEAKPFAYQLNGTRLEEVPCEYALEPLEMVPSAFALSWANTT